MKSDLAFLTALLLAPLAALHAADAPEPSSVPLVVEGNPPACAELAAAFANPPPSARPWGYWCGINGNISKEGITADLETLLEWPDWFQTGKPRPSGGYNFSSCRHYREDSPLVPSGLLGPLTIRVAGLLPERTTGQLRHNLR